MEPNEQTPPATPPAAEARPDWLPEKFSTPEQMALAYGELSQRMGAEGTPPPAVPPAPATPPTEITQTPPADPAAAISELTLQTPEAEAMDFAKYDAEILSSGDISEASKAEIAATYKIPPALVESYVTAKKAEAAGAVATLVQEVGGMENYKALQTWALSNLNEAERAAFNTQLGHKDASVRSLAVRGLYAQFQAKAGNPEAGMVHGGNPAASLGKPFASEAEFQASLADPRWQNDDSYREEVQKRTQLSIEKGTISI